MKKSGSTSKTTSSKRAKSSSKTAAKGAPSQGVPFLHVSEEVFPTFNVQEPPGEISAGDTTFEADGPKELTEYEDRYVAFVDILGFKEMILQSERANNVAQLATALDVTFASSTHAVVLEELKSQEADVDLRVNTFSDFVVASTKPTAAGLSVLLYVIWTLSTGWLSSRILCRGAITRGKVLHRVVTSSTKPTMVFGPAFVEAYKLESTVADFPRIILSKSVRHDWASYKQDALLGEQIPMLVHRCDDGPHCVDVFCHLKRQAFSLVSEEIKVEAEQMQSALQVHLDLTAETPAIYRKARWLAQRFNSAVKDSKHGHLSIDGLE